MHPQKKPYLSHILIGLCLVWTSANLLSWSHWPVKMRSDNLLLTFNSMMDHMLHGRFDVDPYCVQKEGFLRNGRVYAYWGIFPAFLRLPLLVFKNGLHLDITRLSCVLAVCCTFLVNYGTFLFLRTYCGFQKKWLENSLFLVLAFSGVQICFLQATLYQEVCLWAITFGSLFVYWAVRACLKPEDTDKALIWMALSAGLALLTRVTMGIALYAALALFLGGILYRQGLKTRLLAPIMASLSIVGVFIAITAFVNYERWGNPLTFANYNLYIYNADFPDRLVRTEQYGLFNIKRIPLGFLYFFLPVWAFLRADGGMVLQDEYQRLIDAVELPPSSFFLTDGFLFFLSFYCVKSLLKTQANNGPDKLMVGANIIGLSTAPLLMLMAISMNFRYRAEFYPLFLFMAFMGAVALDQSRNVKITTRRFSIILVILSVIFSHIILVLYKVSELGPAYNFVLSGVSNYYRTKFGFR